MAEDINASFVTVGKPVDGGCVFVSFDTSATLPTDATTKMSTLAKFESVGEISENGYTESRSLSTTNHKGWHNKTMITSIDEDTKTYKLEFIEVSRAAVAKLRYGKNNVTVGEDGEITKIVDGAYDGAPVALVIDELESGGKLRRTVVKKAVITSFDDASHAQGSLVSYGITFTVNEPDDGSKAVEVYRAKVATA